MIDEKKQHKINKLIKLISESNPNLSEGIENVIIQDFFGGDLVKIVYFVENQFCKIVYTNKIDGKFVGGSSYNEALKDKKIRTCTFHAKVIDRNHILLLEQDIHEHLNAYQNIAIKFITEELKK